MTSCFINSKPVLHFASLSLLYRCEGRTTCLLKALNSIFSDPCGGIYKYLNISYSCVPPNSKEPEHPITTSLHYNCNMLIVTQMMNVVFKMLPRVNIHCPFFQTESSQTCESLHGELDCGVYSLTLFPTRLFLYAALAKWPTELGSQNLYHWPV